MSSKYNEEQKNLTTSSIRISLLKIMEKKNFNAINISEVCRTAGVSRVAFYRYFKDLEEVIEIFLEEKFEGYMDEIKHVSLLDTYEISLIFFRYIEKEYDFYNTLINSGHLDTLAQYFETSIQYLFRAVDLGYDLEDEEIKYYAGYRAGGLCRLMILWVSNDMKESPETMAKMATKFDFH